LGHRRVVGPDMIDALSRSDEGMIEIEARTARFARVVDILVEQTLRTIDKIEGQEPALPLDRIHALFLMPAAYGALPPLWAGRVSHDRSGIGENASTSLGIQRVLELHVELPFW
jgi:hypothetical protein